MYVGRFVVVGPEIAAYRVSSRSFPNRQIIERDAALTVGPTEDAPETDNPYISYNCARTVGTESADSASGPTAADAAVVGNGSHVDPVTEKMELGYPARDALAESLLALDYEKDDYDTPRIAGVLTDESAFVGTVRKDALVVREVSEPTLVATYEKDAPEAFDFGADTAGEAASEAYDLDFEHAVCAAGVARTDGGFEFAVENGE
ncbi:IMP cyclohydrolase [Halorussus gelatinilyticus]|uniref:IMP cyclohydrolase n=1 Tax=Halorussus gelatinilyticus TaxID=2937524 RepID=A0A8U0IP58_9EURY|nr:IMP cyclohydrolase [Halorussus gelatinilyticus]UPW01789.1 IMP cyclohydrolase [Halorussus gelatinilyticus]